MTTADFEDFFRRYYRERILELARGYPEEGRALVVEWDDLYQFDPDLADSLRRNPNRHLADAREALRTFDVPVDVDLDEAEVYIAGFPTRTQIRDIRAEHVNTLVSVRGIIRKATPVRPKVEVAIYECLTCGGEMEVVQRGQELREPNRCHHCERNTQLERMDDRSRFVDAQRLRIQESPEGLRGGETPQNIDVHLETDLTGVVSPGDRVTATGILKLREQNQGGSTSPILDVFLEGNFIDIEEEEFEVMSIEDEDIDEIRELAAQEDIYERVVDSIAPSIWGYDDEKFAMALQLFSGVRKPLPDGSRVRGDIHVLLVGDPGTGKCVKGDTMVTLGDGRKVEIGELVESNLENPKAVDDGVYDSINLKVPSMASDGRITCKKAVRVWKRSAPDTLYRIRTADDRELEVTPSHPLYIEGGVPVKAKHLAVGDQIAVISNDEKTVPIRADGGVISVNPINGNSSVDWIPIETIECHESDVDWVYDLEVNGSHNYISNGVISHNSQLLQYITKIAPRSVYTSGKGSSAAGLTAAAIRDDFGDGQQWTLEAGALVLADQGIAAVDELDKMRCVTGDTLVQTTSGTQMISELAREAKRFGEVEQLDNGCTIRGIEGEVWTMTDSMSLVKRDITAIHEYDAPDQLVGVELQSGESLTSTSDHPFIKMDEGEVVERPAEELDEGDWICVPRQLPTIKSDGGTNTVGVHSSSADSPQTAQDALGTVLGYLAGDGNIFYNRKEGTYGIKFTNKESELLSHFESVCEQAFGKKPTRPPSEQREDGVQTTRLSGKEIVDELLGLGGNLEIFDRKVVPDGVFTGSRRMKAGFIRALADSEGTVGKRAVKIYSSSRQLLFGTKMLLLEFGVSSQLKIRNRENKRDIYVLTITSSESLNRYNRHIGFTLSRKQSRLEEACANVSGERTIIDVIPDIGELLRELRESQRLHVSETGLEHASTYCNFENGDANLSIRLARDILERFRERKLEAEADIERLLATPSWEELEEIRQRYHISQQEIAEQLSISQATVSDRWEEDNGLKKEIENVLQQKIGNVASVDIDSFETLVNADVKWRKVSEVNSGGAPETDPKITILRHQLADGFSSKNVETIEEYVEEVLSINVNDVSDWGSLREILETYDISFGDIADVMEVADSTVSRWFSGTVYVDNFEEVKQISIQLIQEKREWARGLLNEIDDRRNPRVYDLTVEGTQNYLANGMVVHNSEDRSAMHEALEQQSVSVSKAGINATLQARCALLGAANPKYGRFDQYEPIPEQIELEPALISRFDLIFTVDDLPDQDRDERIAEHILKTNYAGELNTRRTTHADEAGLVQKIEEATEEVIPAIEPDLLRKYVAYATQTCIPTMTMEAREAIKEFYLDLREQGVDEDSPVPMTARKLEALVRLAEASARIRLADEVTREDAERVIELVRASMGDIGFDPETGAYDVDMIETGTPKTQRDRIKSLKQLMEHLEEEYDEGIPLDVLIEEAEERGMEADRIEHEIEKMKQSGEIYEPSSNRFRLA